MKWRNDIKDYFANNDLFVANQEYKINFLSEKEILVRTKRPDLIFGCTFLKVPNILKNSFENKTILHPFTKEEIPILFGDYPSITMGIPAHDEEDYQIALQNNFLVKQVIMPINASLDENKPREEKHGRNEIMWF